MSRMQETNVLHQLCRMMRYAILGVVFLIAATSLAQAQSTEMDRPTRLTSPEASVSYDHSLTHYYTFEAGPGELTFFISAQLVKHSTYGVGEHVNVYWAFYDVNQKEIGHSDAMYGVGGTEEQRLIRITLDKKQTLLLKVKGELNGVTGKYRFRLGGAFDLGKATTPSCLPKQGTLRVKMKDGSVKEIDLKQTEEITIQP